MYEDNDERKLRMKEQTEMKHSILQLYLNPWIKKISRIDSTLLFVDGFAGPGLYPGGSSGSPLIAMDMADKLLKMNGVNGRVDEFKCVFVEKNDENYKTLEEEGRKKEKEVDPRIQPSYVNGEFEDWASDFISNHQYVSPPPGLIFIDPFGYSGIPFNVISDLFQLRDTSMELLITFMAGKMAQWMEDEGHQKAISETVGSSKWHKRVSPELSKDERAEMFSTIYQEQLKKKAGARFTMPFEMIEETKDQTCYYLIHVTNHWQGLKIMKENMFNAGADDQFAYLGPNHSGFEDEQISFEQFGGEDGFEQRVEDFAQDLHERYVGEEIVFKDILKQTLDQNVFKVSHYRSAFKSLENQGKLSVNHRPDMPDGNKQRGYGLDDVIIFEKNLQDFM